MTGARLPKIGVAYWTEQRLDRSAYDEQTPSHVHLPNGTSVASFHRGFLGAAAAAALELWDAA